jgi:hypothetical protein
LLTQAIIFPHTLLDAVYSCELVQLVEETTHLLGDSALLLGKGEHGRLLEDDPQCHHLILEDIAGVSAGGPLGVDAVVDDQRISQTKVEELEEDAEINDMSLLDLHVSLEFHSEDLEELIIGDGEFLLLED